MTDAERKALNTRTAKHLGWTWNESGQRWVGPNSEYRDELPDFADITRPEFGPMVSELLWDGYRPSMDDSTFWWQYDDTGEHDDHFGTATCLAFVAMREAKKGESNG